MRCACPDTALDCPTIPSTSNDLIRDEIKIGAAVGDLIFAAEERAPARVLIVVDAGLGRLWSKALAINPTNSEQASETLCVEVEAKPGKCNVNVSERKGRPSLDSRVEPSASTNQPASSSLTVDLAERMCARIPGLLEECLFLVRAESMGDLTT